MAVGQSDDVDPARAIADVIAQCRAHLGGKRPAAGMLFAALRSFEPSVLQVVRDAFPDVDIVGSTSAAEMSSAAGYREDSFALALFASDTVDITVGLGTGVDVDPDKAARDAVERAQAQTHQPPKVCVMLCASDAPNMQRAVEAVGRALPPDTLLIGGVSSGNTLGSAAVTYQFLNQQVVADGIGVLLLSGPLAATVAVGAGWRPLGPTGVVTSSTHGRILEIDGRPAREFVAPYLDGAGPSAFGNPLAVSEPGMTEQYLRVILGIDEATGGIATPGSVPVGATIQLTSTTSERLIAAVGDAVRRANAAFPADVRPEAALIFSCAVRKYLLGSRTSIEVEEATSGLPSQIPLAGMYCLGEIAPIKGSTGSRLLNESFVTVLLGG